MEKIRTYLRENMRQYTMLIALVFIMVLFQILTDGILLKPRNITKLIQQNSYVIILAIGMLLCILTGGNIDLSIGAIVALVSAMSALLSVTWGLNVWLSIFIGLIVGALAGMWQGVWIAFLKIPSFIVTLAGMLIFRGINNLILQGKTIGLPEEYKIIASHPIPDFVGNLFSREFEINITAIAIGILCAAVYIGITIYNRARKKARGYEIDSFFEMIVKIILISGVINLMTFALAKDDGIPIILVIMAALMGIYGFITTSTIPGRHIYAMGGNEKAAKLSGIQTDKILFWVYTNMGLMSAVAGIVFAGRLNAASPLAGDGFELDAIAACFIGGASATGGIGTIIGAVIGGFIMGILNNGMSIMGLSIFWQDIAKGLVLLGAVGFDVFSKTRSKSN